VRSVPPCEIKKHALRLNASSGTENFKYLWLEFYRENLYKMRLRLCYFIPTVADSFLTQRNSGTDANCATTEKTTSARMEVS